MSRHGVEIAILLKQLVAMLDAERRDDQIRRLRHRNPDRSQSAIMPSGLNGNGLVQHPRDPEVRKLSSKPFGVSVVSRSTQQFEQVWMDRYGAACAPAIVDCVELELRSLGFEVVRNRPYAGGYITEHYGAPASDATVYTHAASSATALGPAALPTAPFLIKDAG